MKKFGIGLAMVLATALLFCACGTYEGGGNDWPSDDNSGRYEKWNEEEYGPEPEYGDLVEQPFVTPGRFPTSTFSLDANTAMYSVMRSQISNGYRIATSDVRIEEYINYFHYDYPYPEDSGSAVKLNGSVYDCPWNPDHLLVRLGLRTEAVGVSEGRNNLVLLIDASGSMSGTNRIGLVKTGFKLLLKSLHPEDRVSIVTYANQAHVVAANVPATERKKLEKAIDAIRPSGGTSGQRGLEKAYELARKTYVQGGNNRVLLISDGDFNVGKSDPAELAEFIQERAQDGIYLSVLGVGMGNYRDDIMETLARNGQGNYGYIDNEDEARRVFVECVNSTIRTVAKDAKAKVTFDPDAVAKYRLIGYENKRISIEDFEDWEADTGEIGSGLTVTALYEVEPTEAAREEADALSFGNFTVRYKDVLHEEVYSQTELTLPAKRGEPTDDDAFIACVAEYGLVLRQSRYASMASLFNVDMRLEGLDLTDEYRAEFAELVKKAQDIYEH